jgi:hypothetical protein
MTLRKEATEAIRRGVAASGGENPQDLHPGVIVAVVIVVIVFGAVPGPIVIDESGIVKL